MFGGEGGEEGRGGTTSIRKTFTPTKHTVTPEHPLTHTTTVHAHCILVFIENMQTGETSPAVKVGSEGEEEEEELFVWGRSGHRGTELSG